MPAFVSFCNVLPPRRAIFYCLKYQILIRVQKSHYQTLATLLLILITDGQMCSVSMRTHSTFILMLYLRYLNIFGYCSTYRSCCKLSKDKLSSQVSVKSILSWSTQSVSKI